MQAQEEKTRHEEDDPQQATHCITQTLNLGKEVDPAAPSGDELPLLRWKEEHKWSTIRSWPLRATTYHHRLPPLQSSG